VLGSIPRVRTNTIGVDMSDGGKGSNPRPFSVDQKTFDSNWDIIFKKKKETQCKCEECRCNKEENQKNNPE
jgi:hypothetical protein